MRHAVKQSTGYIIHVHTSHDKQMKVIHIYIMLKDDQKDIQASESTCQINRYRNELIYIMLKMNLYMQGDQNNHGKYRNHYAKQNKIGNQCNQHVNISNEYGNESQRK